MDITLLGEVLVDGWMAFDLRENILGEKTLIVRDIEYLNVIALDATQLLNVRI